MALDAQFGLVLGAEIGAKTKNTPNTRSGHAKSDRNRVCRDTAHLYGIVDINKAVRDTETRRQMFAQRAYAVTLGGMMTGRNIGHT